jgi:hypothetical protein
MVVLLLYKFRHKIEGWWENFHVLLTGIEKTFFCIPKEIF